MSQYNSFISDFPGRCLEVLRHFEPGAKNLGREVTLMLSLAASGINVPYERLRPPQSDPNHHRLGHPAGDREKFKRSKAEFDELLGKTFVGSRLCPKECGCLWSHGGPMAKVWLDPSEWPELKKGKNLGNKKVSSVVKHIRNALAHGNIYTLGGPQIKEIVLLYRHYKDSDEFHFLRVPPIEFRAFLERWLRYLKELDLGPEVLIKQRMAAAI